MVSLLRILNKLVNFVEASQFCDKNTRQTFHPIFELPRMREWYSITPSPIDRDIQEYAELINEGQIRRQRPKVYTKIDQFIFYS